MSNLCSCPVPLIIPLPLGILLRLMSDKDVNVSYVISIRGVFPGGEIASVDEYLGKDKSGYLCIAPIRQANLGMAPDSPFNISTFWHTISLWDNIIVMAVFGIVMTPLPQTLSD